MKCMVCDKFINECDAFCRHCGARQFNITPNKKESVSKCSNEYLYLGVRFEPHDERFIEMLSNLQLFMDRRGLFFYLDSDGSCEKVFSSKYMSYHIKIKGWFIPKVLKSNFENDFLQYTNLSCWEEYRSFIISSFDWHFTGKWLFSFNTELPFVIDICQDK